MQDISVDEISIKNEKDIKAIAEKNRFYSAAISPLTIFFVIFTALSALTFMYGDLWGILASFLAAVLAMAITVAIHHMLFWSRFGPNWDLHFTCSVNEKRYFIVKDGARRYRVYTADNGWANGISTDDIYDPTFVGWLKNEQPIYGELRTS